MAKIRLVQSKFRILHALHNLYSREKGRKTSVVQADSKATFHTIVSSFSLAMSQFRPVNTLFQIRLLTNCVKN